MKIVYSVQVYVYVGLEDEAASRHARDIFSQFLGFYGRNYDHLEMVNTI
jgi:hypothetical protein